MPTYEWVASFRSDFDALSRAQQVAFLAAVAHFVEALRRGGPFRKGLRVKRVQGAVDVFEMTWADDGRATFEFGDAIAEGEAHIVWHRVGTHAILRDA